MDFLQVAAALAVSWAITYFFRRRFNPLMSLPTIGPSAPLLSYLGAFRYLRDGETMLREGYQKYYGTVFKIAMLDGWIVVFTGPKLIDELRKSPDEDLSAVEGTAEILQLRHTLGPTFDDQFHVAVVRDKLTRNLGALYPDVLDEVNTAWEELVPPTDDWTEVCAFPIVQQIIARVGNRVMVGLPICHDKVFLDVSINFTNEIFISSFIINLFPEILKPLVGSMLPLVSKSRSKLRPIVIPLLQERQRMMELHGDSWEDKPRDMLQWLLEEAASKGTPFENVVEKVLLVNFGAIHTSSGTFTHALYNLAAYSEYLEPLREEVETIIAAEGWNKASLAKMRKLDSFFKESMRLADGSLMNIFRKAVRDVTLSDGTRIPKGTLVAAASVIAHTDDAHYTNPHTFDPFRFARMRDAGADEALKHQLVNTSVDFITFGHGRHACPGRFFAANEIKTMMAYLVLHYDVKFADEGKRPDNIRFGHADLPSHSAKVLFRKRRAA
ncbi:cytochrome P450 [Epithele typhae]|uniref:cytochrome P450 n=1 Tax=Epithele typhae TaxID=378194 RepID=UPI002008E7E6|nr:cytochrome P450 [Epithele typhae]KAH9939336.1 cytochrome P450 [Epithele typhae]